VASMRLGPIEGVTEGSLGFWPRVVLGDDVFSLGGPSEDIYLPRTLDVPVG
jgi:hypothetical protein